MFALLTATVLTYKPDSNVFAGMTTAGMYLPPTLLQAARRRLRSCSARQAPRPRQCVRLPIQAAPCCCVSDWRRASTRALWAGKELAPTTCAMVPDELGGPDQKQCKALGQVLAIGVCGRCVLRDPRRSV